MTTTKTLESTVQPTKDQVAGPAVLITGALTGIGRATALAFAREGARIVVSGRRDDKGDALVSELQAQRLNPTPTSEHARTPWRLCPPAPHSRQRPRDSRRENRRI